MSNDLANAIEALTETTQADLLRRARELLDPVTAANVGELIDHDAHALACLSRNLQDAINKTTALFDRFIEEVAEKAEKELSPQRRDLRFIDERYGRALLAWAKANEPRAKDPEGGRSIVTLFSKLILRKDKDKVEVVDKDAFLAWARSHPTLVRCSLELKGVKPTDVDELAQSIVALGFTCTIEPKQEPAMRELTAHVKDTGEIPPGVELIRGEDQLTIE